MRIDTKDKDVLNFYDFYYDIFLGDDSVVDLCLNCGQLWIPGVFIDHPDYDGGFYRCLQCGKILSKEDNNSTKLIVSEWVLDEKIQLRNFQNYCYMNNIKNLSREKWEDRFSTWKRRHEVKANDIR